MLNSSKQRTTGLIFIKQIKLGATAQSITFDNLKTTHAGYRILIYAHTSNRDVDVHISNGISGRCSDNGSVDNISSKIGKGSTYSTVIDLTVIRKNPDVDYGRLGGWTCITNCYDDQAGHICYSAGAVDVGNSITISCASGGFNRGIATLYAYEIDGVES